MNLPSNHSNSSCCMPPSNPSLRLMEPCLTHNWSRDPPQIPRDEAALQFIPFYELSQPTRIGGDLNSLGSPWEVALNAPKNDNNGHDLGSQSPLFTKFVDGQHISQPDAQDYGGEQWYSNTGFEALDTLSQHVYWSDVDYQIDTSSLSTDTSATATEQPHHQSDCDGKAVCNQCSQPFPHKSALDKHAKQAQHKAHACSCGVTFTRFDVLNRHLQKFSPRTFYPCSYCAKYTGMNAFTRGDHLTQHLRGYHKIEISTGRGGRS